MDDYTSDVDQQCLVQRGVGARSLGQSLAADRVDLNGDGIPDYVISDRYYCSDLSANQSAVFFVMLSAGDLHHFRLAYAAWASQELVVIHDDEGHPVLMERSSKLYGDRYQVFRLLDNKFVPSACVYKDEHGYSGCELR